MALNPEAVRLAIYTSLARPGAAPTPQPSPQRCEPVKEDSVNDEDDLTRLRAESAAGSRDATDQLVELAGERGDLDELRRLAESGSRDALDQLVELAGERGDLDELRRLADAGSQDAADVLEELTTE